MSGTQFGSAMVAGFPSLSASGIAMMGRQKRRIGQGNVELAQKGCVLKKSRVAFCSQFDRHAAPCSIHGFLPEDAVHGLVGRAHYARCAPISLALVEDLRVTRAAQSRRACRTKLTR